MNTLNKVLKCYSDIYSPHKQMIAAMKNNGKFWIIAIGVYLTEIFFMYYFLFLKKELWAATMLLFYLISLAIVAYLHYKKIEKMYGSLENFDITKIRKFRSLVQKNARTDLYVMNENQELVGLISDDIEKNRKISQSKRTVYIALIGMTFPLAVKLFSSIAKEDIYTAFLLVLTLIGILILLYSLKAVISSYYSREVRLEQIREICKEIRLEYLIERRLVKKDINTDINNEIIKR